MTRLAACCAGLGYACFVAVILIAWAAAITQGAPWFAFLWLGVATALCGFMGRMYAEMIHELWNE